MVEPLRVMVLDQAAGLWGAQSYLLRLAGPLADRGIEMTLAAPADLELAAAWQEAGLPFVELDLPTTRSVRAHGDGSRLSARAVAAELRSTARSAAAIAQLAEQLGVDVIHGNGHAVHVEAAMAGRKAGVPTVLHLHEEMEQGFGRLLRAIAVATARRTVAVSRAVAEGVPRPLRGTVEVIANGVDTDLFAPGRVDPGLRASLGASLDDVLLVALTRLDPEKRIEDLLAAVRPLVRQPGWQLAIAGSTSRFPEYARAVQEQARNEFGDRVTFVGRRTDVVAILRTTDIFVHAGVVEGMPLGLLEAGACAVPVVAYDVAGIPEAVRQSVTGLLVPARDSKRLGAAVAELIEDPARRRSMGRAAREHVLGHHRLEAQVDAQAELLRRISGRVPGRVPGQPPVAGVPVPKVLIVNHWHDDNRGDSAISQGILTLLRSVAPDAAVTLATLSEKGPQWGRSTRLLTRDWTDLRAIPNPMPTELRDVGRVRTRQDIAMDLGRWWLRLIPSLPGLVWPRRWSQWRGAVADSDLVVAVGGSNIFDDRGVPSLISLPRLLQVLSPVRTALRTDTPVLLLGHTLGPFSRRSGRAVAQSMMRGASAVLRETNSLTLWNDWQLGPGEEAPDMAFAVEPTETDLVRELLGGLPTAPERTLALSIRQHPTLSAAANRRLTTVFADAARQLRRDGWIDGVVVVAHTIGPTPIEDDRAMSRLLVEELSDLPAALIDADVTPSELSALYGRLAGVVAVRLHAAILALSAGSPTFAVSYLTGKTKGVMTQVGLPDSYGDFASVEAGDIARGMADLWSRPELRGELLASAEIRRAVLRAGALRWFAALSADREPEASVA